jgi:hypothetical protein
MDSASRVSNVTKVLLIRMGHMCDICDICMCIYANSCIAGSGERPGMYYMLMFTYMHACVLGRNHSCGYVPLCITGTTEQAIAQREFFIDSRRYRLKHTQRKDRA